MESGNPDLEATALESALAAARHWSSLDPDPSTRQELDQLIEARSPDLIELFDDRIAFGTAGLRSSMGPGPKQMNRLVVRQTTAGLMRYLPEGALVVVGYDARYNSADFARDTAAEVVLAGGRAQILPGPLPTPVLAHLVLTAEADAGIMITASHNPPADNGYKLYLSDGIQLVSPADEEIAAAIDEVAAGWTPERTADLDAGNWEVAVADGGAEAHINAALAALETESPRDGRFVYTAMHGVGGEHFIEVMQRAGFADPIPVPEQFDPDPDFPTADFPNPEEPGALDLAMALAAASSSFADPIDAIIAHDPDADRLALAVVRRGGDPTKADDWERLTGDQVGVLLADHLLGRESRATRRLVSKSIVSSRMLDRLAEFWNIDSTTTLTGFKWVARPIVDQPDAEFVLGYEEALGYCVGSRVRDKDGISAGLVAAELLATLKRAKLSVWDRLDGLATRLGVHLTGPVTIRLEGADGVEKRTALLDGIIADPPQELGGARLSRFENLSDGSDLPPTPGVVLHYDDDSRVIVRPSGTEPKLKAYIEVVEPVEVGASVQNAEKTASQRLAAFQQELQSLLEA